MGLQRQRLTYVPGRVALVVLVGMGKVFGVRRTAFEPFRLVPKYFDVADAWTE